MTSHKPLMPKATAVWLIENTALSFEQIAEFCHLHALEVQHLADQEHPPMGFDPILNGQLTSEEISRCEMNAGAALQGITKPVIPQKARSRYTPLVKRVNKPNAIAWMVKHYPHLPDAAIKLFLGTTTLTIQAIRHKTHPHFTELKPQSPAVLGFCTQSELDTFLVRYDVLTPSVPLEDDSHSHAS